jgi:ketosteroid isomerase-like protein
METVEAARRWRDTWLRAWPAKDVEAVRSLYGEHAVFRSQPFREPRLGAEGAERYASWAFDSEETPAECRFGEPIVDGDRALCEYWAVVRSGGTEQTIAGVSVLRFDAEGLVAFQRDYWAVEVGRRDPPDDWGR